MQREPLTLAPFYRGWHEYQDVLSAAIAPLTPAQLALHASPGQRPLWRLVAHIIGARVTWFARLGAGSDHPTLAAMDLWNADGAPPCTAQDLIRGLDLTWAIIEDCLNRWSPAMLDDQITYTRADGTWTHTRQWILWHVIEHDLHHGGEISLTLGNHGLAAPDV